MPQVGGTEIRERAARLRGLANAKVDLHLEEMQGRRVNLLMERPDLGRTEGFAQTRLTGDHRPGTVVAARITGRSGGALVAEAA